MKNVNMKKISIYFAIIASVLILIMFISNMKERIAKLEVKVEYLMSKLEEKAEHLKD